MTSNINNSENQDWLPLEADPQIIHESGVDARWKYIDIHAALALILLFPSTARYNEHIHEEETRLAKLEQSISPNVVFFKQTIQSACGMIALLHSLANNDDEVLGPGPLYDFLEKSRTMSPDERTEWLKQTDELHLLHDAAAAKLGHSDVNALDACHTDFHYVCFVEVDNHLYELDGRRPLPVNHGKISDFVKGSAKVIKQYMDIDPDQRNFNVIALVDSK
ncbi:hypothetical protein BCR42DRAFT_324601 [Absidia repens]|uniref:Ubiquitin carboxyl-terminal hydrolase n=1 Tax=Absidia repens TaxID=90262 RepID=A0A1X2ILR9_9FUNG|nr:hypothetical protein BCR42DRAFT_324601 [Absidia repens]